MIQTQEQFAALCKDWELATDKEREEMLPFLSAEERRTMVFYYAVDRNRMLMIHAYYDDKKRYIEVTSKFPGAAHWRDLGEVERTRREKEIAEQQKQKELAQRTELYKSKRIDHDFAIVPIPADYPGKPKLEPKTGLAPATKKPKREATGGINFEGLGEAEDLVSLRDTGPVEGSRARAVVVRRGPKPE